MCSSKFRLELVSRTEIAVHVESVTLLDSEAAFVSARFATEWLFGWCDDQE